MKWMASQYSSDTSEHIIYLYMCMFIKVFNFLFAQLKGNVIH